MGILISSFCRMTPNCVDRAGNIPYLVPPEKLPIGQVTGTHSCQKLKSDYSPFP